MEKHRYIELKWKTDDGTEDSFDGQCPDFALKVFIYLINEFNKPL